MFVWIRRAAPYKPPSKSKFAGKADSSEEEDQEDENDDDDDEEEDQEDEEDEEIRTGFHFFTGRYLVPIYLPSSTDFEVL